jgi:hypothetical protein
MLSSLGLRAATIFSLINRLSSSTLGRENIGSQLDAITNGTAIGFGTETLQLNPQATPGTTVLQKLLTDSIGSVSAPTGYLVTGNKSPWRIRAGDATTGGVSATSGIVSYTNTAPLVRGSLLMQHGDFDGATSIVLDQLNFGTLPGKLSIKKNSWDLEFEIADWTNRRSLRTVVLAELGVAFGVVDPDPANNFSALDFAVFELSQNQIRFKSATYAGAFTAAPLAKDFKLSIKFDCQFGLVTGYVDGKQIGQTSLTATNAAQIGARTLHKAGYVAATPLHEPIGLRIDTILASCPLVEA